MLRISALALVCTLAAACTAGKVTREGQDVAGATVTIYECDNTTYTTMTAADGTWAFNPTSPTSADYDNTKFIPPGPILIHVEHDGDGYVEFHNHSYGTCEYTINGVTDLYDCRLYPIDFVAMDSAELVSVLSEWLKACNPS